MVSISRSWFYFLEDLSRSWMVATTFSKVIFGVCVLMLCIHIFVLVFSSFLANLDLFPSHPSFLRVDMKRFSASEFAAMPENSMDPTASGENNISGPDFFGLYKSEIDELLSQDDSLLPFPHQASRLSGNLNEVGREKGSTKKSCQSKESNVSTGSASLFSNGIGALLSESKKERLHTLLRQSVFTLSQEIDEVTISLSC